MRSPIRPTDTLLRDLLARSRGLPLSYPETWTILRPGVIYGPGDDLVTHLVKMIRFAPEYRGYTTLVSAGRRRGDERGRSQLAIDPGTIADADRRAVRRLRARRDLSVEPRTFTSGEVRMLAGAILPLFGVSLRRSGGAGTDASTAALAEGDRS